MKTSLIVTTYENPAFLRRVTDSILLQTVEPHEVLIADDGSGKETEDVVTTFARRAPFAVRHVWQEDRGFRAAAIRNEAIRVSSGDYIILLDGDCIPNRHFIADHSLLAERGYFFQGKRINVSRRFAGDFGPATANSIASLLMIAIKGGSSNIHHLIRLPALLAYSTVRLRGVKTCNMGFFREDVLAVNGFNENYTGWGLEDSDLACRFFKYGLRKKVHPFRAICFHLWHPLNKHANRLNEELLGNAIASETFYSPCGLDRTGTGRPDNTDAR